MTYRYNPDISLRNVVKGSVQMVLNWKDCNDDIGVQPCMMFRKAIGGRVWIAFPLSQVHEVMQADGYAALRIVNTAAQIADAIGFARGDRFAARDVADLILENTDPLCKMPSEPPADVEREQQRKRGPAGEMAITIDGETLIETEVPA